MPKLPVNTAVTVVVGPCVDDTDFKTQETAIAYNAAGMNVDLIQNSGTGVTKTDLTLTTGGNNDWTHKGSGYYEVELTAAQNNVLGSLKVAGICTGVLPFESETYEVVPIAVYNAEVAGTGYRDVNAVQVDGAALGTHAAGYFPGDARYHLGQAIAVVTTAGVPKVEVVMVDGHNVAPHATGAEGFLPVDPQKWRGEAIAATAVAGQPVVTLGATQAAYTPLTVGGYTAPDNADIVLIKTQTDKLQFAAGNDLKATLDSETVDVGKVYGVTLTAESGANFKTLFHNAGETAVLVIDNIAAADALATLQAGMDTANAGIVTANGNIALIVAAPTAAAIASAVCNEVMSGHVTNGTLGKYLAVIYAGTLDFNGMIETDGSVKRFTANAVEQAPTGSGGTSEHARMV